MKHAPMDGMPKHDFKGMLDTGRITNHLAFARASNGILAYVTVGGENTGKAFASGDAPTQLAAIQVGALPHGISPFSNAASALQAEFR